MTTCDMIRELRRLEEAHRDDFVGTGETNWSSMCRDVANRLEELLSAHMPRVMTVEEAKSASGYVFVQSRLCNILDLRLIEDGIMYDSFMAPIAVDGLWWEGYNKYWRLWTSCPTETEQESTPWE